MNKEAIVEEASKLESTHDLLILLNKIKMDELGDKGYPFTMPQLNYYINPIRNKKSYRNFRIPKKSGGYREISAPKAILKSLLTYTNKILQALYEAPGSITGFVTGKSVVDNAEKHIGRNYIFNIDLQDFFPSISKSRVWATLKLPPYKFNDTIADAIAGLCCTEIVIDGETRRALPQGSPCSPILTNIVCRNLDRQLNKLAKKYNLTYSRYADDITFSSNHNVYQKDSEFRQELDDIIKKQNFSINSKKTRLQQKNHRQEVTGLVVSDRVNVTKDYVRDIDNILYIWDHYSEDDAYARFLTHYSPKHNLKHRIPNLSSIIQGRLNYLKMVKGADNEVWRRLQRKFNKLTGTNKSSNDENANIKYIYSIPDFEKKVETQIIVTLGSNDNVYCYFTINNYKTSVNLSKYVKTRLKNIVSENNQDLLKRFMANCILIFYEKEGSCYWKIERRRKHSMISDPKDFDLNLLLLKIEEVTLEPKKSSIAQTDNTSTSKSTTDEILDELVDSGFDLNILDKWDKIKSS
ncbi:MAG: RNA-directed DNA polymerase [Bacteroidales bacterium]|nr:RNA-directed DNA polymerase [Bacteroidales bacterium]